MKRVFADRANNILNVKISGIISSNTANEFLKEIGVEIKKLKPDFDIITDMSNFRFANSEALTIGHDILKLISQQKVGKIVRVVGSSQNAVILAAGVTKAVEGYKVEYVPTIKDAYKYLNKNITK